jgi:hypothetical protein
MNKSSIIWLIIIFSSGLFITNCVSNSKIVNRGYYTIPDEKANVTNSAQEIVSDQSSANSDFQKFIAEADTKINLNEENISELKLKSIKFKGENNNDYLKEIEGLEIKNYLLKMKLDNYVQWGDGNWLTFKTDFNQGLDELQVAFENVDVKEIN